MTQNLDNLLQMSAAYPPPARVTDVANLKNYDEVYARSVADTDGFWGEVASELSWFKPWEKTLDWQCPHHRWFVGGQVNITYNALDRHLTNGNRNKVAFIWLGEDGTERQITYGQLHGEVCRAASALKSLGVGKGDRVIVYMPLTLEGAIVMLACARIGAIHSVVYAGLGSGALRERIDDSQAKVVFTSDVTFRRGKAVPLKPIVDEAVLEAASVEHVVVWRRVTNTELTGKEMDYQDFIARGSKDCPAEVMDAEDPLFILYTSGTTAKPKGIVHVHGGYMVGIYYMAKAFMDFKPDDVYWCTSDIGWIVGHSYIVYGPLVAGVTTVFREGALDFPDPGKPWEIVEKYDVSVMFTAPTAIRLLMKYGNEWPQKYNISSLRYMICAGEPLNPEAWRWAYEHLISPHDGFLVDNWWQTEIAGPTLGTLPIMAAKPGKVGRPLPGVIAEVVDAEGNPMEANKGGLLVLRKPLPHMMKTIFNDPYRYAEVWDRIPGSYATGDMAVMDEEGYIAVLGRADDVLNIAGHRIGTMEVESALVSHPAVAEAAAIGKPDPVKGEVLKTFVTLRLGFEPSPELEQELIKHVKKELGPIVIISELEFATKLPKTRSGKIIRRLLKAREMGQDPGDLTTLEE
ncbi:acetate--CoA ligase [Heliophilum fasciatum]|uniref:Acetate--CoA ligase n=1 Tax=Heliophilum fasciatum TaxID=35700 RepID=A0A4R2RW18_9FIRM|nr:acetate--CoA ligase [Heliophilum fasciatum]MCW2276908.1 acetyl-CoA synthetase [Heliophilum fasciatum]TCP68632.1 acetyl-coenzyme A synthetase [Heliophilum fasciatum]